MMLQNSTCVCLCLISFVIVIYYRPPGAFPACLLSFDTRRELISMNPCPISTKCPRAVHHLHLLPRRRHIPKNRLIFIIAPKTKSTSCGIKWRVNLPTSCRVVFRFRQISNFLPFLSPAHSLLLYFAFPVSPGAPSRDPRTPESEPSRREVTPGGHD